MQNFLILFDDPLKIMVSCRFSDFLSPRILAHIHFFGAMAESIPIVPEHLFVQNSLPQSLRMLRP